MLDDKDSTQEELNTEEVAAPEDTPAVVEEGDSKRPVLPPVNTSSDDFAPAPVSKKKKKDANTDIFKGAGEVTFFKLDKVFERQVRDYTYFLKFRKYSPIKRFVEQPARAAHLYERKFWGYSLFDRFCMSIKHSAKHIAIEPFSLSGDHLAFERETLYTPQKCPAYVASSMAIMEKNMQRFAEVMTIRSRDIHDPLEEGSINADPEYNIKLSIFWKKGKTPRFTEEELSLPTTKIDRYSWPYPLQPSDAE